MTHWQYLICIAFTWTGFICAISFMEAWLKFRAPGVTLPVGLSIGKLIFGALNKVEWFFAVVSALLVFYSGNYQTTTTIYLAIPILLLSLQTIWLLPAMNKRIDLTISGVELPKSKLHFYYIGAELAKVISLVVFGVRLFA